MACGARRLIQCGADGSVESTSIAVSELRSEAPVLLYDGSCGFCNATVQLVLRHDRRGTLRFAAIQSPFGERALARHPELRGVDSVVWVDPVKGQVLTRSGAGLRVAAYLGGLWRLALLLWIVPRPIRDWGYDLVARHRHLLIGRAAHCLVPSPDVRHRFLDGG
jgi:predicted DCC family thiol-disulfide oxidoreductase YuxK